MPSVFQISRAQHRPSLSIVFIHGSGGDHLSTWMPKGQESCLMHWLAEDLKEVDVLSVAHEADAKSFVDYSTLVEYASAIAYGLAPLIRSKSILFVCHSLGGLIAKQIVIAAPSSNADPKDFARDADFCFIGTPHAGVHFRWLRRAHMLIFRNQLGRILLGDSETLRNLNANFVEAVAGQIVCFAERRRWHFFKLMPDESGFIDHKRAVNLSISKTHEDICKPTSRDDVLYQAILRLGLAKLSRSGVITDSNFFDNRVINEALESLQNLKNTEESGLDQDLIRQYLEGLRDKI